MSWMKITTARNHIHVSQSGGHHIMDDVIIINVQVFVTHFVVTHPPIEHNWATLFYR